MNWGVSTGDIRRIPTTHNGQPLCYVGSARKSYNSLSDGLRNRRIHDAFSEKLLVDAFKKPGSASTWGIALRTDLELTSVAKVIAMSTPRITYYKRVNACEGSRIAA